MKHVFIARVQQPQEPIAEVNYFGNQQVWRPFNYNFRGGQGNQGG